MSSSVRLFLRSKKMNIKQEQDSQAPISRLSTAEDLLLPSNYLLGDVNDRITSINSQQKSINISCFGGNEKKNAAKNQINTPNMIKKTAEHTRALADSIEASDHKVEHVYQQNASKIEIDNNLKDLFGNKEIAKAIINQLAQRALTGSMNSNNDNPPRLCTKKHVRN